MFEVYNICDIAGVMAAVKPAEVVMSSAPHVQMNCTDVLLRNKNSFVYLLMNLFNY